MKKANFKVSVIMPIYNTEKYLEKSIDSILNQTLGFLENIQLILVNDGSTDQSETVCLNYMEKYPKNIEYISQSNCGVSETRNKGIKVAVGRYICFLDSDDTLTKESLKNICNFFDEHYNEIDMVTYKILPITNGKTGNLHYRYQFLTDTGIYNLNDFHNIYACITNVNICIKNLNQKNILFRKDIDYYENQIFNNDMIKRNMKIGYVDEAEYLYLQQSTSASKKDYHAYYLFELTTSYWENLFFSYNGKVPMYFQAMFMNDISWKTTSDFLKPYQYDGDKFNQEYGRILSLINMVDDEVILNHPGISEYLKYYFINLKDNHNLSLVQAKGLSNVAILSNNELLFSSNIIDIDILKMKRDNKQLYLMGYLKNPVLLLTEKPTLYLYISNQRKKEPIDLRKCSYDYLFGKEKITKTYLFEIMLDIDASAKVEFKVEIGSAIMKTNLNFSQKTIFQDEYKKYEFYQDGFRYSTDKTAIYIEKASKRAERNYYKKVNNENFLFDKKRWLIRKLAKLVHTKKEIWLYYDCEGVLKDNGYYQFIHDVDKKDGVVRYFITTHTKQQQKELFTRKQRKYLIKFKSLKHKLVYLSANKIITAYIEQKNHSPYTRNSFKKYMDISKNPEIIYLQHGVLHAHMPWKYSLDRLLIDKEVISTYFEQENLIQNYSFLPNHLITSGMPRYDYVSQETVSKNVILFAPSWRNYLIDIKADKWISTEDKFLNSTFYKETMRFLNSGELADLLEKYDYQLDFKLHPIFKRYEHLYKVNNSRVIFGTGGYTNDDYKIFITDYSSFVFDFVYLKKSVVYFFPDYDLFKAGLNVYREIDLPFEKGFGEFCETSSQLLERLNKLLANNGKDEEKYQERMNGFFIHNDNHQCDRIYEALKEK